MAIILQSNLAIALPFVVVSRINGTGQKLPILIRALPVLLLILVSHVLASGWAYGAVGAVCGAIVHAVLDLDRAGTSLPMLACFASIAEAELNQVPVAQLNATNSKQLKSAKA
ncbi:hypothetical protein [Planktothrix agardhii]|uniref:hypothetical protein n=1 Tax=Planktothrix agardhii TaxID=1160 RepID=UPI001F1A2FBE|nr:hypothetical protein [Planktothrix agardhii]MCF3614135.1 hypothetical protein [Planktothrix agardhii 1027]